MEVFIFLLLLGALVLVEVFVYRKHGMDDLSLQVRFSKDVAGNGEVIEAMGTMYGVVKTQLEGRGWTHWLQVEYISYR